MLIACVLCTYVAENYGYIFDVSSGYIQIKKKLDFLVKSCTALHAIL